MITLCLSEKHQTMNNHWCEMIQTSIPLFYPIHCQEGMNKSHLSNAWDTKDLFLAKK